MDKKDVVHIYNGLVLSHAKMKKKIFRLQQKWMDLEGIMLREVSQKEIDKYYTFSFIGGI